MTRHWKSSRRNRRKQPKQPARTQHREQWAMNITQRNARTSPLLRLPGEIRNQIYDYALVIGEPIPVSRPEAQPQLFFRDTTLSNFLGASSEGRPKGIFALLHVCYQLYEEAACLPYKLNTFAIKSLGELNDLPSHFRNWQLHAMTSIIMTTTFEEMHSRLERHIMDLPTLMPGLRSIKVHVRIYADWYRFYDVQTESREKGGSLEQWLRGMSNRVEDQFQIELLR